MKQLFSMLILSLCLAFVSCNEEEYNADLAVSPYQPLPGRRVASVKTIFTENGGENIHEHRFTYDAQNRIKTVNSNLVIYTPVVVDNNGFRDTVNARCNMVTSANYFYRGEKLEVAFNVSTEYPDFPKMNRHSCSSNFGFFTSTGVLNRFSQASFDYSTTILLKAYTDGEISFDVLREGNDVCGYNKTSVASNGQLREEKSKRYYYSPFRNKTNFDFSAYFGYWGVEQCIPIISRPYRAPYQLAAFGMLGVTSGNLPWGVVETDADGRDNYKEGDWVLDNQEYPLSFVDVDERVTVITYCE